MNKKPSTTSPVAPVVVRFPKNVIVALDKAADKNDRSRSSEIRARVMRTFRRGAAA